MSEFIKNLDDLLYLSTRKESLMHHLHKNYKENIHFIIKTEDFNNEKKHGGHNKKNIMLTEHAFELLKNSYNLRNRYIVDVSDKVKCVNIGMCIENQTIGFIENSYVKILNVKRQYYIGKYRVDLYFVDYKLVIECDENNHDNRDPIKEKVREDYLISEGNKILRYNPNTTRFDLSNVLSDINLILFAVKV